MKKTVIYAASCTKDGGIGRYLLEDGKLRLVDMTPMDRPMYMAVENDKMYILLMAPFANGESGLVSYDIGEDGALLNPSEITSTKGIEACHLSVENSTVYAVNYVSGSVFKTPDLLVTHEGSGPNLPRQDKAHTHFAGFTPDKKYLCVVDLTLDTIFLYDRDLHAVKKVETPRGQGVRHLAFSADGKFCFAANELGSSVSVFAYDGANMKLLDTASCLPADFKEKNTAAAIRCFDGKIFVSNRGHDSVAILTFDGEKLQLESCFACGGSSPRDMILFDDYLLCANQLGNSVTVFKKENGTYVMTDDVKLDAALALIVR